MRAPGPCRCHRRRQQDARRRDPPRSCGPRAACEAFPSRRARAFLRGSRSCAFETTASERSEGAPANDEVRPCVAAWVAHALRGRPCAPRTPRCVARPWWPHPPTRGTSARRATVSREGRASRAQATGRRPSPSLPVLVPAGQQNGVCRLSSANSNGNARNVESYFSFLLFFPFERGGVRRGALPATRGRREKGPGQGKAAPPSRRMASRARRRRRRPFDACDGPLPSCAAKHAASKQLIVLAALQRTLKHHEVR